MGTMSIWSRCGAKSVKQRENTCFVEADPSRVLLVVASHTPVKHGFFSAATIEDRGSGNVLGKLHKTTVTAYSLHTEPPILSSFAI